jgi:tetratricopeptide (TPR) repeat protein
MDYLVYASLQKGSYSDTVAVLNDLKNMGTLGSDFKVSYAATAMPVRYALERKQWKDATHCASPAGAPPHVAALAVWARALGDARTGDVAAAKSELQALRNFAEQLRTAGNLYWAGQVDIQAEEAGAWIAFAEHKPEDALALLKKAADEEDAVEKLPVTPGPVVPAREQLADLLAMMGRPKEALAEYETSLQNAPGRRASLQGAMESAKAAGATQKSGQYQAAIEKLN